VCSGVESAPHEMSLMTTGQMVLEGRVVAACSDPQQQHCWYHGLSIDLSAAAPALSATFLASPPNALPEEAYPTGHSSDHFNQLSSDAEMASEYPDEAWTCTMTDGDPMDLDDAREG